MAPHQQLARPLPRWQGEPPAEVAGLALGSAKSRSPEYEARGQAVAGQRQMAGADEALTPPWTGGGPPPGRGRSAAAIQPAKSYATQTLSHLSLRAGAAASVPPLYPVRDACARRPAVGVALDHWIDQDQPFVPIRRGARRGPGRPMVLMPPRPPTAFVITRGRCPGPYTRLRVTVGRPRPIRAGHWRTLAPTPRNPAAALRCGSAELACAMT